METRNQDHPSKPKIAIIRAEGAENLAVLCNAIIRAFGAEKFGRYA
jgi:hypothetical protein